MDGDCNSQIDREEFVDFLWNRLPMDATARGLAIDELAEAVLEM